MKGFSLTQPWASLVARERKRIETRSWSTPYRGPLLIHAAKGFPAWAREFADELHAEGVLPAIVPRGCVVAVARLVDVKRTEDLVRSIDRDEERFGDYAAGRYGWLLADVRSIEHDPVLATGALGLWTPPADVLKLVAAKDVLAKGVNR